MAYCRYIASLLNNQFNLFFFLLQIMVTFIHVPRVWGNWHAEVTRGKQRWFSHSVVSNSCDPMDYSLPMGFSRQEYWSGLPFPSPGDLPSPGLQPRSPALQADSLPTGLLGKPWKLLKYTQDPSWSGHLWQTGSEAVSQNHHLRENPTAIGFRWKPTRSECPLEFTSFTFTLLILSQSCFFTVWKNGCFVLDHSHETRKASLVYCSPMASNCHLCKPLSPKRLLSPQISEYVSEPL